MLKSAIVCVDDEWNILRSLGDQLKHNFGKNYNIEFANSAEDALLLCAELTTENTEISLIISDQRMPGIAGDALLIQLHTLYPKALKILLTGRADADSVGNVVNAAALYRYIRKPWDQADLVLTVAEALRRFEQEKQLAQQNVSLAEINAKLESSLLLLLATLDATADGIIVLDSAGRVVSFNQRFTKIWNLPDSISMSDSQKPLNFILESLIESDAIAFQELLMQEKLTRKDYFRLKNGSIFEYYLQPQQLAGNIVGNVWNFRDVTQEKRAEALVKHQASHDALTNLPNRLFLNQKLFETLAIVTNNSESMALMFLDLDQFKQVNDTLGHSIGDLLLQAVVRRFAGCLRESDVIARWGGDEFVLLVPQIRCREDASEIAHRIIEVLQPEFLIGGNYLNITVSVGIAVYPHDGVDSSTLLQNADAAVYYAKSCGRNNYKHYSDIVVKDQP
jgi:diguanylate cyclase (GGDEF)-like protein/PAS domain S-box-containing protein